MSCGNMRDPFRHWGLQNSMRWQQKVPAPSCDSFSHSNHSASLQWAGGQGVVEVEVVVEVEEGGNQRQRQEPCLMTLASAGSAVMCTREGSIIQNRATQLRLGWGCAMFCLSAHAILGRACCVVSPSAVCRASIVRAGDVPADHG